MKLLKALAIATIASAAFAGEKEVCEMNKHDGKLAAFRLQTIQALQDAEKSSSNSCKDLKAYLPTLISNIQSSINVTQIEKLEQEEINYRDSVRRLESGLTVTDPIYSPCTGNPRPANCMAERFVQRKEEITLEDPNARTTDVQKLRQTTDALSASLETAIEKSRSKDCPDDSPVLHAFLGAAFNLSRDAGYVFPGGALAGVGISASLSALSKLIKTIFTRPNLREKMLSKLTRPSGDDVVCLMNSIHQKLLRCGLKDPAIPERTQPGVSKMDPALAERYDRSGIPQQIRTLSSPLSTMPGKDAVKKPLRDVLSEMAGDFAKYEKLRDERHEKLVSSDAGGLRNLLDLGRDLTQNSKAEDLQKKIRELEGKRDQLLAQQVTLKTKLGSETPATVNLGISEVESDIKVWESQGNDPEKTTAKLRPLRARLRELKAQQSDLAQLAQISSEIDALNKQIPELQKGNVIAVGDRDSKVILSLIDSYDSVMKAQKDNNLAALRSSLPSFQNSLKTFNAQFSAVGESPYLLHSRDQEAGFALNAMARRHSEIMKDLESSDGKRFSDWKLLDVLYRDNQLVVQHLQERATELADLRAMERDLADLSNALIGTYNQTFREKLKNTVEQANQNRIFPRDAFLYCTLGASSLLLDESVVTARDDSKLAYKWVKVSPEWNQYCMPLLSCYVADLYKNDRAYDWPPRVPEEVKGAFFWKRATARAPSANGQPEVIEQVHHYMCKLSIDSGSILKKAEKEFYEKGTICGEAFQSKDDGKRLNLRPTAERRH